jgi:hypothetical protein
MTTHSGESNLTIQLLMFDKPTPLSERFNFLEMSTLQVTKLLTQDRKVISCEIFAYTSNNKYLDKQVADGFRIIGDFNNFFSDNPEYYIHDCEIVMEGRMIIRSHDDGEVSIQFPNDSPDQIIITTIFEKYDLDKKLIDILKSKAGIYLAIDKKGNLTGEFENFDDYITHGT